MLYFDTSILTPLVMVEPTSGAVEAFTRTITTEEGATSHWTSVEFASLAARHVRMGHLPGDLARDAIARFDQTLASSFTLLHPSAPDFTLAKRYLGQFETGLRG